MMVMSKNELDTDFADFTDEISVNTLKTVFIRVIRA